jgi:hypothetical protein
MELQDPDVLNDIRVLLHVFLSGRICCKYKIYLKADILNS